MNSVLTSPLTWIGMRYESTSSFMLVSGSYFYPKSGHTWYTQVTLHRVHSGIHMQVYTGVQTGMHTQSGSTRVYRWTLVYASTRCPHGWRPPLSSEQRTIHTLAMCLVVRRSNSGGEKFTLENNPVYSLALTVEDDWYAPCLFYRIRT